MELEHARRTLSVLMALIVCMGFGLISASCGAGKSHVPVPEATPDNPVPESTLSRLKECAEKWADDLQSRSYEVGFELTINERGEVRDAEPIEPRLGVRDMESCLASALRTMFVPEFVMERVSSELSSRHMPAGAPDFIGQTEAMDKFIITLGPIIIEAGPVAIILTLAIVATAAMVKYVDEAHRKRCEEQEDYARKMCEELLKKRFPSRKMTGGHLTLEGCMKGYIDHDCPEGNPVDHGPRPGRKW